MTTTIKCGECGHKAHGNDKDGFRCSNSRCYAQHEYDDINAGCAAVTCVGCGAVGDFAQMPIGDHACPDCYATAKAESEAAEVSL